MTRLTARIRLHRAVKLCRRRLAEARAQRDAIPTDLHHIAVAEAAHRAARRTRIAGVTLFDESVLSTGILPNRPPINLAERFNLAFELEALAVAAGIPTVWDEVA